MEFPAHLLQATALTNFADDAVHGLGGVRPPTLSIGGQRFTAVDAGGNEKNVSNFDQTKPEKGVFVDVIFVDANPHLSHTFYEGKYDPSAKEYSPPDCFSDNGVAPSDQAINPQSPTCAACPRAVWGSAISEQGSQTKACRDAKKTAVLIPAMDTDMPFLLRIPPASLSKQFAPYIRMLAQQNMGPRRLTPADVVTRIHFVSQGVLGFEPTTFITPEQLVQVQRAQSADAITAQIIGKLDKPHQGALPAPAAQAAIPQQAPVQQFQTAPQIPQPANAPQPFITPQMQPANAPQPFITQQAPQAAQAFAQPVQQAQQPQQEPVRRTRRGRTNPPEQAPVQTQQTQQPVQQAPVQQFAPQQGQAPVHPPAAPAFMMGGQAPQQMAPPMQQAPVQTAQAPSHGMVSAPPPTAELAATLANAFGPQGGN